MLITAEQSDEQKKLLEKEAKLRHEQDTNGLDNAKLEAELWRHDLETRGRKVEAVVAEVLLNFYVSWDLLLL